MEYFIYKRTGDKVVLLQRVNFHDIERDHITCVKALMEELPKEDNTTYSFQMMEEGYEIFKETNVPKAGWLGSYDTLSKESLCHVGITSLKPKVTKVEATASSPAESCAGDFSEVLKELKVYLDKMNKDAKISDSPELPPAPMLPSRSYPHALDIEHATMSNLDLFGTEIFSPTVNHTPRPPSSPPPLPPLL